MKRKIFILFTLAITMLSLNTFAQSGQTRSVSGFSSIESGGPFNVHVKIGGTESVRLDVDDDVVNDVKTDVEGGVLKIGFRRNFSLRNHNIKRGDIYVTAKSLNGLSNSGSGNLDLDGVLTGQSVSVILSGSGNMRVAVKASALETRISGSGGIHIKGNTESAQFRISGSGEINGTGLTTETLAASISGSGSISIIANKTVSARITGSGGVSYSGNATIGETKYTGSGRVNKVN
ncbi:GIN domain-containing protein [Mucilaginibacter sp. 22184]|uniref:GIN domain-containing protein n=1 Tax=Mucilaginibacter sp. 22184 TaxID=3453887 RepID=UPI003F835BC4